ncbi:MAG: acyl-CoA desaturase, partial [Betaproteobacteria bacterium]
ANRYDVLQRYARSLRRTYLEELERLRRWSPQDAEALKPLKSYLTRMQRLSESERVRLSEAVKNSRALAVAIAMRDDLVSLWERSNASKEQLVRELQEWCQRAEASGVGPLAEFSRRLRCYA